MPDQTPQIEKKSRNKCLQKVPPKVPPKVLPTVLPPVPTETISDDDNECECGGNCGLDGSSLFD